MPVSATRPVVSDDGFDVLDACHRQMLFTLGKLSALITRLAGIGPDEEAQALAREVFDFFDTTVRRHHEDEERHVFPPLVAAGDPDTVQAVLRLAQDHDWLEEDWMELQPQLAAIAAGQAWCNVEVLRDGAAVFSALLHDHIALEESMIYPQARERLRERARCDMGREMAARRRAERQQGRRTAP
ncbi:hemerythrin domain-containing protein [Aquincola sp. S2]|uniref:Hemerythrin domain-containing protein n=1 Tax=Pseudaquabacterium terrae TaxID=2732868 RepID=A0ABX2ERB9_9BURK|nr:hemerythrin domain-containing protein [Aquabacterium terrae]NRF71092.1 hemerythrin domain-containing protein [Aquabacterium terrae]